MYNKLEHQTGSVCLMWNITYTIS